MRTFDMKEIMELTGIEESAINYFVKSGLLKDTHRDKEGNRIFSEKCLKNLEFLKIKYYSGESDTTYVMKEIVEITKLSASTIRYYESIGLMKNIRRDDAGRRVFTEDNLRWIEFIKRGKATGMSIKKLIEYGELLSKGERTSFERREILKEHLEVIKKEIQNLNDMKEYIKYKIGNYDKIIQSMTEFETK